MNTPNEYTVDHRVLPADGVESLVWRDGLLFDWVNGNLSYNLDGTKQGPTIIYPYRFDAAVVSPSGSFVALYERLGTKAIVLGPHGSLRELNRSYYHAHVYEYPILFFRLPDGREALAHCPEEYCDLRIEDPATGELWSEIGTGSVRSLFHSRLAANPAGNRILSAGWFWHPADVAYVFNLTSGPGGRLLFEQCKLCADQTTEINSAVFNCRGQLVVASASDAEDFGTGTTDERLRPGMIGVLDLDNQRTASLAPLEDEAGTLIPLGRKHVIGLYDHPKLIDVETGRTLFHWPDVKTGLQKSSIIYHRPLPPPIAFDPVAGRLAVADDKQITVVTLSPHLLEVS